MTDLLDAYLRELALRLPLDADRKERIVAEMRAHLVEKADEIRAADPALSHQDAMRRALNEFGAPDEVAAGYRGPEASSEAAAPMSPKRKRLLVGVAIFVALNFVGGAVAAWVAWNGDREDDWRYVYPLEYARTCDPSCGGNDSKTFRVHPGDELGFHALAVWWSQPPDGQGAVRVVLRDPSGAVRLDTVLDSQRWPEKNWTIGPGGTEDTSLWGRPFLKATALVRTEPGYWSVHVEFFDFSGTVQLQVVGTRQS